MLKEGLENKTQHPVGDEKDYKKFYGLVCADLTAMLAWPFGLWGSYFLLSISNLKNIEKFVTPYSDFTSFKEGLYVLGPLLTTAIALTTIPTILGYHGGKYLGKKIYKYYKNQEQKSNFISASQNLIQL